MTRQRLATALIAASIVLLALTPLAVALVASLTPDARLFDVQARGATQLTTDHYRALFAERAFWVPIRNSLIVAVATTVLALALGAPCAYALARWRFRGRAAVLALILAMSMFPQISVVPSLFLLLRAIGLIDSYPGLVLPYLTFAMPLAVWFLVTVFRQLPVEIEEAAMLDGASRFAVFRRIALPLAAPGLATTGLLTFLYCWNEFLFALTFTLGPERHTVPVAIALFRGQYQVPWGEVLAAALVATTPIAVLVLVAQRRLVSGLTSGGVKG
jgi:ABC-type glycerol-3-phosphate transport system permease component